MYMNVHKNVIIALQAESAIAALNCSGVVLGSLPIRSEWKIFPFLYIVIKG